MLLLEFLQPPRPRTVWIKATQSTPGRSILFSRLLGLVFEAFIEGEHLRIGPVSGSRHVELLEVPKTLNNPSLTPDFSKSIFGLRFAKTPFKLTYVLKLRESSDMRWQGRWEI